MASKDPISESIAAAKEQLVIKKMKQYDRLLEMTASRARIYRHRYDENNRAPSHIVRKMEKIARLRFWLVERSYREIAAISRAFKDIDKDYIH